MSLASTAAIFETDNPNQNYSDYNSNETPINKKRMATNSNHNKTQKRIPFTNMDLNHEKVNSVLQSIHNSTDNELGDFNPKKNYATPSSVEQFKPLNPLAPPVSMKSQQEDSSKEGMRNRQDDNLIPKPLDNDDMELQELQSAFLNDAQVRNYYKKLGSNYQNKPNTNHLRDNNDLINSMETSGFRSEPRLGLGSRSGSEIINNDVLLNKINYMINLLEDQQDERTNNVTEEVVLYSFLGIFIIFVVDSFARVGKYTR
jgi:hypothetical protein